MKLKTFKILFFIFALKLSGAFASRMLFQFGDDPKGDTSKNKTNSSEKIFDYFVSGFDYENRPVVVMPWGSWDLVWLVENPVLKERFLKHYNLYIEDVRTGAFAKNLKQFGTDKNDTNDEIVVIVDYDGFQFRHISTPDAVKFVLTLASKLEKCYAQIPYGYVINANPLAYQVVILSKPTAGNFLQKMDIHGTNSQSWIPKIQRMIPQDQLPPAYGGSSNFKPLVTYNFLE